MKRKILAALLTLVMVFSLLPVSAWAEETTYSDVAGHWAQSAILRWSDYGVLQGSEGKFSPDGTLTRGQMAVILSRLLNLPAAPSAGFTDVAPDAWYADGINRCAAAGILQGSEGKAMPEDPITREQAMVMLCRALGIAAEDVGALAAFSDLNLVSDYARPYVAALVKAGVVKGDANGLLNPLSKITRAEIVTMIDRLVGHYAKDAGAFVDASDGALVIVVAENVKIVNAPAGTKIIVAEKATGLTVNGTAVSDDQTYIVPEQETKPTEPSKPSKPSGGTIVRPEHRHSYAIKFDQNYHWEGCDCGATRNKTEHTWTEKVTTEPTCTEAGTMTYTCVCGATKMEEISATGHSWGEYEVTTAATCTQPGVMTSTCSNCGGTQTKDIHATGHDFEDDTCINCDNTKAELTKAALSVASGTSITAAAYSDYSADLTISGDGIVNASSVTVGLTMKDVASLGITGQRHHEIQLATSLSGSPDLKVWLSNLYAFQGTTVNADINGEQVVYTVGAYEDGVIHADANAVEAARAAWQELAGYVTASTKGNDNSYIVVANGSSLQVGSELLSFEMQEDLTLDNFSDMSALQEAIREHIQLTTVDAVEGVEIVLKEGTQLAVGGSIATLDKDMTITVTGIAMGGTPLADLRGADNTYALMYQLVTLANQLIGAVDAAETVNVTIR